jgi:cell wall-associated NlpC family hydrolase
LTFDAATDRRLNLPQGTGPVARELAVVATVVDLRATPDGAAGIDTQLLRGAIVDVHDEADGWALIRARADSYVGWLPRQTLGPVSVPTHRVAVPRTFVYPGADMKLPRVDAMSMGSLLRIRQTTETRGTLYCLLEDGGAIVASHLAPVGHHAGDPVAIAETLLHTPYLWGGASAFGLDCSGLVQLCHAMCGNKVLRDTDMQAATIGGAVSDSDLRRGDLVFWRGHVAMMLEAGRIIHASGRAMSVTVETLSDAMERIRPLYGAPTVFRRPG